MDFKKHSVIMTPSRITPHRIMNMRHIACSCVYACTPTIDLEQVCFLCGGGVLLQKSGIGRRGGGLLGNPSNY